MGHGNPRPGDAAIWKKVDVKTKVKFMTLKSLYFVVVALFIKPPMMKSDDIMCNAQS